MPGTTNAGQVVVAEYMLWPQWRLWTILTSIVATCADLCAVCSEIVQFALRARGSHMCCIAPRNIITGNASHVAPQTLAPRCVKSPQTESQTH